MQVAAQPHDEPQRISALHALAILDTPPEERFDRLTRLAKRLFSVPIALVSLIDTNRQWFKSHAGLDVSETPRNISFCGHAILGTGVFVVEDAASDPRFSDNPLVTGAPQVRFYAGCPLKIGAGPNLGTLCLIDRAPRSFSADDMALLRDLARMAEQELAALQLATMDELTHLSNRRGFEALALHALGLCTRTATPASLLFFDLDQFKAINDRFGHAEGDRALRTFAGILKDTFRHSDVVARLGGDEFAVLFTGADSGEVSQALQRLHAAIDDYNRQAPHGYTLGYSVGTVPFDSARHAGIAELVADADGRMYEHKRQRQAARRA